MDLGAALCYAPPMPHAAPKRFCLVTLGCKVNQYESQALAETWTQAGLLQTDAPDLADLVVLCSCAVTARAEAESRRLARNLVREANDTARVVVTGCAAVVHPDAFAALDAVPVPDKAWLARHPLGPDTAAPRAPDVFPDLAVAGFGRARGLVKVQDGCSHGCSYCIVPTARGASVSRPFPDILAEVKRLLAAGHREIGLTGINLGHYGRDLRPAVDFWDLLASLDAALALEQHAGTARLRLGSLDPAMLDGKGLAVLAHCRLVCPHLHVSLQSADPAILATMGRRPGDAAAVSSFMDSLGREWPVMGLGLDLLTGFPGESEAAFGLTADFLTHLPATYAHVFPYSRRPGTRAADLPGQLPRPVKAERAKALRDIAEAKSARFQETLSREPVLHVAVERTGPTVGTCAQYVDCRFETEPDAAVGSLVAARPVGTDGPLLRVAPLALDQAGRT